MDQLVKTGKVQRGVLGVAVQLVSSDIAASLGIKDTKRGAMQGAQGRPSLMLISRGGANLYVTVRLR